MIQTQEKPLITERPNEEDLSGATLDQIISRSEEVYKRWEELCDMSDPESFCEDCEHRYTVREREEYWGSICYREFETCRAEFDPEDPTCPRSREYEEALENRNRIRKALDTLYQAEEAFMNKKGA